MYRSCTVIGLSWNTRISLCQAHACYSYKRITALCAYKRHDTVSRARPDSTNSMMSTIGLFEALSWAVIDVAPVSNVSGTVLVMMSGFPN